MGRSLHCALFQWAAADDNDGGDAATGDDDGYCVLKTDSTLDSLMGNQHSPFYMTVN